MKHMISFTCLLATLLLAACLAGPQTSQNPTPAYYPTQDWRSSSPEEQGVDSAKLADALLAIRQKNLNIHSLLVIRNGMVVVDAYFYPYDGKTAHDMASVTKSVMTTLIALAADRGKLKLDDPVLSFFSDRVIANRDARKEHLTVRHLAGMVNGLESVCLANDEGTLEAMKASPDWVQFALDRKMTSQPGSVFCYDSPGMHLLSAILEKATGMTALEFARQNLFEPLGIHQVMWLTDPQGHNIGSEGLYLYPRDAAKIGFLWQNNGVWDGKQIISAAWVQDAVKAHITTGLNDDYGYGWWVMKDPADQNKYAAVGRGGQRIGMYPGLNTIIVTTGGGFEPSDATSLLAPTVVDLTKPLPANSQGAAALDAALTVIAQSPAPTAVAALPEIARVISGKTFVLDPNPKQLKTLRLDFDGSAEGKMLLTFADTQAPREGKVGLDGVYRLSPGRNNLPAGMRGFWSDGQTFFLEYDEIANHDAYSLRMRFEGNQVTMDAKERAHESGFTVTGRESQ